MEGNRPSPLTLYELNNLVRQLIEDEFSRTYWITAELSDVHPNYHCFLEFVQKDNSGTEPIAKARGQIWSSRWSYLKPRFESTTGRPLSKGMQVLAEVEVTFHEKYGYSLNVVNLDPTYTLGDIERRKKEIIAKLKAKGIYDMNKSLPLPMLMNRIAVISASGAAGYQDFCNQLAHNPHNLKFHTKLFEAVMQGVNVEKSIINALNRIFSEIDQWDTVVIIRGGGATSDLNGFDNLLLGENVAQFPIPIITGIGHDRDRTVIDEVAHTSVKTPTAAAEFLINHQYNQLQTITDYEEQIVGTIQKILTDSHNRLSRITEKIPTLFTLRKERELHHLSHLTTILDTAIKSHKIEQSATLQMLNEAIRHAVKTYFRQAHNKQSIL